MAKIWPSSSLQAPSSDAFLGMVPLVPLPWPPRPRPARPPSLPPFPRPALAARAISLALGAPTDARTMCPRICMHETTLPWLRLRGFLHAHTPDAFPAPASLSLSPSNYWGSLLFFAGACKLALDTFPALASSFSVLGGLSLSPANSWSSSPVAGGLEDHENSPRRTCRPRSSSPTNL